MNKMKNKILSVFMLLLLFVVKPTEVSAVEKYRAVDGDSLEKGTLRIRLIDIDAPELFQECYDENNNAYECGIKATNELRKYIAGGIICKRDGVDRYKRSLMECFDKKGESINRKMVLSGWAVAYGDKFKNEEIEAKNKNIGIWKGRFMRPELYRALHKNQKNSNKFEKR